MTRVLVLRRPVFAVFVPLALVLASLVAGLDARPAGAQLPVWTSVGPPMPRQYASVLYDPIRDRMIVCGGDPYGPDNTGETWALSFAGSPHWSELARRGSIAGQTAIYDPVRDRMVTFGGQIDFFRLNATDQLSLGSPETWSTVAVAGAPPSPRWQHAAVYDPLRDRMLVLGGFLAAGVDTQLYQLTFPGAPQWSVVATSGAGPGFSNGPMAYDSNGDRLIVIASDGSGAWALSLAGSPAWASLAPAGTAPTGGGTVVFDAPRNRLLLARTGTTEIWALTLTGSPAWSPLATQGGPPGASNRAMILDPSRDRVVLFGGAANDSWALALATATWSPLDPGGPAVPGRVNHTAVVVPPLDALLVFGGEASQILGDAWTFALGGSDAWSPLAAGGAAPVRTRQAAVYDPNHQRMVVFGGLDGASQPTNDIYLLSLAGAPAWSHPTVLGPGPAPRSLASATFDALDDRVLVYGGQGSSGQFLRDVWALTLDSPPGTATWTAIPTVGSPPDGSPSRAAFYQASHNRMIVIEGTFSPYGDHAQAWALTFGASPKWARLAGGALGLTLQAFGADYDPVSESVLVFGGAQGAFPGDRTFRLSAAGDTIPDEPDTTPPQISVSVSPTSLWPANRKMVDIRAQVVATDNSGVAPVCRLKSIVSSEPDSTGKSDPGHDIQGADTTVCDTAFQLRAERLDGGGGRRYTITYIATDGSGNSAAASADVIVPLKKGGAVPAALSASDGGAGNALEMAAGAIEPAAATSSEAWSEIATSGPAAYARALHTFTRDPARGNFVAFGGWTYPNGGQAPNRFLSNSTVILHPSGAAPAAASHAIAAGRAGQAPRSAPDEPPASRTATGSSSAIAPALALSSLHMTSARELAFVATLAAATPAQLEVFDISGRRVATASIGGSRGGAVGGSVRFGAGLSPGLYLVRVRQGSARALGRFVALR